MCLRPLMHDLNCFVNVNRWKSIGSRVDFSKSSKMCMPCINHAALSRPLLFFYTCLTRGLRYCQKQDISVCMSRSNWPMKPFIKKTFAPESVSSDLKWAHLMNVEWSSNSIFSFLIFFKTHIRLHRIYWFYTPFRGQLCGAIEKIPPLGVLRPGSCLALPLLAVCSGGSHLTFFGNPSPSPRTFGSREVESRRLINGL